MTTKRAKRVSVEAYTIPDDMIQWGKVDESFWVGTVLASDGEIAVRNQKGYGWYWSYIGFSRNCVNYISAEDAKAAAWRWFRAKLVKALQPVQPKSNGKKGRKS